MTSNAPTAVRNPAVNANIPPMHITNLAPASKIHIINGGQVLAFAKGTLNRSLADLMAKWFRNRGHEVRITHIDDDSYNAEDEIATLQWANVVILQFPGFWMSVPWKTKLYFDDVITKSHSLLWTGDGRSRHDQGKLYGSGGLAQDKLYMISSTWNAPKGSMEAGHFFGQGVDGSLVHVHRVFQFLGMQAMPGFMMWDVIKNPQIEKDFVRLEQHLHNVFERGVVVQKSQPISTGGCGSLFGITCGRTPKITEDSEQL